MTFNEKNDDSIDIFIFIKDLWDDEMEFINFLSNKEINLQMNHNNDNSNNDVYLLFIFIA